MHLGKILNVCNRIAGSENLFAMLLVLWAIRILKSQVTNYTLWNYFEHLASLYHGKSKCNRTAM